MPYKCLSKCGIDRMSQLCDDCLLLSLLVEAGESDATTDARIEAVIVSSAHTLVRRKREE